MSLCNMYYWLLIFRHSLVIILLIYLICPQFSSSIIIISMTSKTGSLISQLTKYVIDSMVVFKGAEGSSSQRMFFSEGSVSYQVLSMYQKYCSQPKLLNFEILKIQVNYSRYAPNFICNNFPKMDIFVISKSILSTFFEQSSCKFQDMFLGSFRRDWPVQIFELGLQF